MAEPVILLREVHKAYGPVVALRGVTLEVQRGEIFGFLGPNGAGKTTTIRCLLDLIRPQRGEIRVFGLDPRREGVAIRRRVGYLPGELHLDDHLTAQEHFELARRVRGRQVDWTYVRQLAERLDLDTTRPVRNLSRGNKQKVGVILALMHRPELLILDEPTTGLDPLMQREVLTLLREAREAGATVFFSSHIISEVEAIADRVGIIREGQVVEVADPESLIRRAIRRVHIRFREPVDVERLTDLPGVSLLRAEDSRAVTLQVHGTMEALIQALAHMPVVDLDTERPSLEEVFLAYYAKEADAKGG